MLARFFYLVALLIKVGEPAGPLILSDQYERAWQLADQRGAVVVLLDADQTGSKYNSVWGRAIRTRYGTKLKIAYVAHLQSVPGFMHGFVRGKFHSKDPARPNGPILLDWKGEVAKKFGFRENVSNVHVIDREGVLCFTASGQGSEAEQAALFQVLDRLLPQ